MTPDPKPTEAMKPCPNHSRYTEGCTACFVEAGTSTPGLKRDAEAGAMREFIRSSSEDWCCDTLSEGQHCPGCRVCKGRELLADTTAGAGILERLAKAEEGYERELKRGEEWCGESRKNRLRAEQAEANLEIEKAWRKQAEGELAALRRLLESEDASFKQQLATETKAVLDATRAMRLMQDELTAVTAERDRAKADIAELVEKVDCHPAFLFATIDDLIEAANRIPDADRLRQSESNLRELRASLTAAQSEIAALRKELAELKGAE